MVKKNHLLLSAFHLLAAAGTAVLVFQLSASAQSSLILAREFDLNLAIPEGGEFVNMQQIDYGDATISDLKIGLSLSGDGGPMFNGDWYAGVGLVSDEVSSGYAVLLNRVGRTVDWDFGYFDDGFDVVFDDNAPDIHLYQNEIEGPISGSLTGVWSPSGREALPENVLDTDPRTAMLGSFDGSSGVGELRLFLSHESAGGAARLNGWSYEMNVFADPGETLRLSTGDTVRTSVPVTTVASDVRIDGNVNFAAAGDISISGSLTGSGKIQHTGGGKFVLSEEGDFSGIVSVTSGNLQVTNQSGSATGDAAVTVSDAGLLSGNGQIGGPVSVFGGGRISPGLEMQIGKLTFGDDLNWNEDGIYLWKISDVLGIPGAEAGWDMIEVVGVLSIGASVEDPFLIKILSLNDLGQPGLVSHFDGWTEYSWSLARAGSILGFDLNKIEVDASDFVARNPTADGTFSIVQAGREIAIHYAPIPEPRTYALGAGVMVLLVAAIGRRLRKR